MSEEKQIAKDLNDWNTFMSVVLVCNLNVAF